MTKKELLSIGTETKIVIKNSHSSSHYKINIKKGYILGFITLNISDITISSNQYSIDKITDKYLYFFDIFLSQKTSNKVLLSNLITL